MGVWEYAITIISSTGQISSYGSTILIQINELHYKMMAQWIPKHQVASQMIITLTISLETCDTIK